ncbi:hypothetical protein F5Y11DRAFT_333769 [Daldinia sp. FL1419]|nr:hypothetical protein F5Y11DRAFT_333769 [Daldinia sp. FL1419]
MYIDADLYAAYTQLIRSSCVGLGITPLRHPCHHGVFIFLFFLYYFFCTYLLVWLQCATGNLFHRASHDNTTRRLVNCNSEMASDRIPRSQYESLGTGPSTPAFGSYEAISLGTYPSGAQKPQEEVSEQYLQSDVTNNRKHRKHHVFRFWPWEIASLFVAIGSIAATYSILSHFDGHEVPEWPLSINLNTLIALISTIMRAAMLVGVAEVISQTKWTWFSRPRPLRHLQSFDQASRSITGSMSLLFVAPKSAFGVLGALITVLSLGVGPFTQQTVKSVACLRTHSEVNASLPVAQYLPGNQTYYRIAAGVWELSVDTKGALVNGVVNPTGNDTAIIPTCPTGNCTFTSHNGVTHASIGLCSSCIDTTAFIKRKPSNISHGYENFTLPGAGMWVSPDSDQAYLNVNNGQLEWAEPLFTPEFESVCHRGLLNVTILAITKATCLEDKGKLDCPFMDGYSGPTGIVAVSCALYPCLKNYDATMMNGVLSERIVSTKPARINRIEANITEDGIHPYMNWTALQTPCFVDGESYDLSNFSAVPEKDGRTFTGINVDGTNYTAPDDCMYKLSYPYWVAMNMFLRSDLFQGICTYNSRQGVSVACNSKWWLSSFYRNGDATFETLSTAFDRFSTAVTNKFRTTGSDIYDWGTQKTVNGLVNEMTVCTQFQWQWLLMPTILVAATAAILITMIIQNVRDHKQPVWKSSLLPLLYYGFGERAYQEDPNRPIMDISEMNKAAAETKTKFRNGVGAGFVDVTPTIDELVIRKGRNVEVDSLYDGRRC